MIELTDIQTSIGNVLQNNGYTVIASEVKESFPKPSCFIEVMPVNASLENKYRELVTVSVEITYHPEIETSLFGLQNILKIYFCTLQYR